jgi:hypothetical protein
MRLATTLLFVVSMTAYLSAIEIQFDYSLDTNNFFHPTNFPERRAAMEAAAAFFEEKIDDNLLRIDPADFPQASWTPNFTHPSTGGSHTVPGLVIPEDTIIIYLGARSLPGSTVGIASTFGYNASGFQEWFDRIDARGQSGVLDSPATDTSAAVGSIAFDTSVTWNFSQNSNGTGFEFMNTALHEIAHILGIGTADAWANQLSAGTFTGTASTRSNGNTAPTADGGHFLSLNSTHVDSFGVTHGSAAPVLMLPSVTDDGSTFKVATDLDLAALTDLGWEVNPDPGFVASALSPSGVTLNWNSVSFKEYEVQRATALPSFSTLQAAADGDGSIQDYSDPSPPSDKAFYRLVDTNQAEDADGIPEPELEPEPAVDDVYRTIKRDPVDVACKCH